MSEILICVKDRGISGNLAIDSRAPKRGDVVSVFPDGAPWGECDLGGPTYTRQNGTLYKRDVSLLVKNSVDLATLVDVRELSASDVLARSVGPELMVADQTGKPDNFTDPVVDQLARTVNFTIYQRRVTSREVRPISDHPNGNHNFIRILKLPNVTVAQATTLLAPEDDVDPLNPSPYLQYRAKFLDKSKIPPATMQALIDHWNDDGRAQGFITLNYTAAQINSIVSTRPPIPF